MPAVLAITLNLPAACDPNPASAAPAGNLCPAPVGMPRTNTKAGPVGLLQCPAGSFAVGLQGQAGALIDEIRVFDNALTPADVQSLFTNPAAVPEPAAALLIALPLVCLPRRRK